MSRFSLDNHIKKDTSATPAWAQSRDQIERLYHAIVKRVEEIENLIKQSGPEVVEKLKIKERKVVASQIADSLKIKRSNIRPDREPDLVGFINNENDRLMRIWKNRCSKVGVGQRLSKDELEDENKELMKKLEAAEQKTLHGYFDRAVESEVLESQKNLQEKSNL